MVPPCHQQYTVITCTSATLSPMVSVEDEMWRRTHRHKHSRTRTCACTRSHTCTRPQATAAKKLDLPGTDWVLSVQNPKIQDLKHMRDGLIAMIVVAGLVLSGGWASWHGLTVGLVNVVHTYDLVLPGIAWKCKCVPKRVLHTSPSLACVRGRPI